jgi:GT2 family glycosyltransferase
MEPAAKHPENSSVSVIVVSYNGSDHIKECLESLCRCSPVGTTEICVVDNGSSDDSVRIAKSFAAQHGSVLVLESATNRGYAGGVNFALPHVNGDYIVVLNQDMVVEPGWLNQPVSLLEASPEVGAVSPMMVLYDSPDLINSLGQNVHVTGLGFNRWLGHPRADAGNTPFPVSGIHGGAFVIRRTILDQIGGWDDTGFLYHEDVELSWLLHVTGSEIYCAPGSVVRHKYHLTMHPEKLFLLERNRWHMLACDLRVPTFAVLAPLLLCTEAMMWGFCLLRGPKFLLAKARACLHIARTDQKIGARRRWIKSIRRRTDWQVLCCLKWSYVWNQFATLGKERGAHVRR